MAHTRALTPGGALMLFIMATTRRILESKSLLSAAMLAICHAARAMAHGQCRACGTPRSNAAGAGWTDERGRAGQWAGRWRGRAIMPKVPTMYLRAQEGGSVATFINMNRHALCQHRHALCQLQLYKRCQHCMGPTVTVQALSSSYLYSTKS